MRTFARDWTHLQHIGGMRTRACQQLWCNMRPEVVNIVTQVAQATGLGQQLPGPLVRCSLAALLQLQLQQPARKTHIQLGAQPHLQRHKWE